MGAWAVARHEVGRATGGLGPRAWIAVFAAAVLVGAFAPLLDDLEPTPADGVFLVAVAPGSPYTEVIPSIPVFTIIDDPAQADLVIRGTSVVYEPGEPRSMAAYEALRSGLRVWSEQRLLDEEDQAAAFPLLVSVIYHAPAGAGTGAAVDTTTTTTTQGGGTPTTTGSATPGANTPTGTGSATQTDSGTDGPDPDAASVIPDDAVLPSAIEPPFPARSLLLTFAFVIPMNFVAQLYAGALMAERTQSRGRALLSAPMSPGQVLLGRSIPYLGLTLITALGATVILDAGFVGLAAALVVVAFILSAALLAGLTARSPRELTFLLVAVTTGLSTFLFLPAMFPSIPPVAFLSPISVVAASIRGEAVHWAAFMYATLPLAMSTLALGMVGASLYREESLFSPRSFVRHLLDGIKARTATWPSWLAAGALLVPFTVALELFVIGVTLPLGLAGALPAFLLGTAAIEEIAKALPSLAWRHRATRPMLRGALIGTGFFLGEKVALVVGLIGFPDMPGGNLALATFGVGGWVVLIAPWVLHVATATLTSLLVAHWPEHARWWWLPSTLLHAGYNAAILGAQL